MTVLSNGKILYDWMSQYSRTSTYNAYCNGELRLTGFTVLHYAAIGRRVDPEMLDGVPNYHRLRILQDLVHISNIYTRPKLLITRYLVRRWAEQHGITTGFMLSVFDAVRNNSNTRLHRLINSAVGRFRYRELLGLGFSRSEIRTLYEHRGYFVDCIDYNVDSKRPRIRSARGQFYEDYKSLIRSLFDRRLLICHDCGNLADSCACGSRTYVQFVENNLKFHGGEPNHGNTYIPRHVGVELEISGFEETVHLSAWDKFWSRLSGHSSEGPLIHEVADKWSACVREDGSLRGNGFEFCTAPARGSEALKQLGDVTSELRRMNAFVDGHAGGHVHVSAKDLSDKQINHLFAIWWLIEDTAGEVFAPNRLGREYCTKMGKQVPSLDTSQTLTERLLNNTELNFENRIFTSSSTGRYHCINRRALRKFGTLEFRFFGGVVSYNRAVVNAAFVSRLVHLAKNASKDELLAIMNMTPLNIVKYICGPAIWRKVAALPAISYHSSMAKINYARCEGSEPLPARTAYNRSFSL